MNERLNIAGFEVYKGLLDRERQRALVAACREIAGAAPMDHYQTPWGKEMSVAMTSAGAAGWVSDRKGYRYAERHGSGSEWPPIPDPILAVWKEVGAQGLPNSCLVNYYGEGAKMGLHVDDTEEDTAHPVVSVSLGDDALFRMGGLARRDPTSSIWLTSGDVVVMGGAARLAYHGIDRIRFGSSTLLEKGGRLNLTLRFASGLPGQTS